MVLCKLEICPCTSPLVVRTPISYLVRLVFLEK